MSWPCQNCGLPDLYHGDGDGIGSCECARCETCGAPPLGCSCDADADYYGADDPYDDGDWRDEYEAYLAANPPRAVVDVSDTRGRL